MSQVLSIDFYKACRAARTIVARTAEVNLGEVSIAERGGEVSISLYAGARGQQAHDIFDAVSDILPEVRGIILGGQLELRAPLDSFTRRFTPAAAPV